MKLLALSHFKVLRRAYRFADVLGRVGTRLVLFALFPSQSLLDFPSPSGNGIKEVVHVGVFGVELAQKSVDGGRDNGWPRGSDSIHTRASARVKPTRYLRAQDDSPPPGAVSPLARTSR
jgi:hypothetical protein